MVAVWAAWVVWAAWICNVYRLVCAELVVMPAKAQIADKMKPAECELCGFFTWRIEDVSEEIDDIKLQELLRTKTI